MKYYKFSLFVGILIGAKAAEPVIKEAFELEVRYCDSIYLLQNKKTINM